jgi:hypothetical protein
MMVPTFGLLALIATSDAPIPLPPPQFLGGVAPEDGDEIPANGAPIIFGRFRSTPQLFNASTGVPVEDLHYYTNAIIPILAPMQEGTVLALSAACTNCAFSASWTIGPADNEPPVVDGEATREEPVLTGTGVSDRYKMAITLPTLQDQSPTYFELVGDGNRQLVVGSSEQPTTIQFGLAAEPEGRLETCISIAASDLAFSRQDLEPICLDQDAAARPSCAAGGLPHALGIALVAVRRRRRSKAARDRNQ